MTYIIIVLIAYLLGSFCASIPLSKHVYGGDVRENGSGNAGATNMARVYGMKAGIATFVLDAVKTAAAMLIGAAIAGEAGKALAGAACIVGHCWPVYFSFRGGKGVSVGAAIGLMTGLPVFAAIIANKCRHANAFDVRFLCAACYFYAPQQHPTPHKRN